MQTMWREARLIVQEAIQDWFDDDAAIHGAALAFYCVLSLAPLLGIALAVTSMVFDAEVASKQFLIEVETLVGKDGSEAIGEILKNAAEPKTGAVAAVFGVGMLLIGASGVFGQLQETMDKIWDAKPKHRGTIWAILRARFLSFSMVLGTGFLLLVSLLLSSTIGAISERIITVNPELRVLAHLGNEFVSFVTTMTLFAMIFKFLPDKMVAWRDVWIGALITAILFAVGKFLIGLYLGNSALGSSYGAAGSLVVLLVWVYYSAQVLIFGAEIAHTQAERRQARQASARLSH
jgi:membrane protein